MKVFADFRVFLAVGGLLLLPALLAPAMPGVTGCTALHLCSSRATPWGLFTSLLVYDGWQNAAVFFILAGVYLPLSTSVDRETRKGRSRFMAAVAMVVAVASNAVWAALVPYSTSFGQSGVVYAAWGLLLAFCVMDMLPRGPQGSPWKLHYSTKEERSTAITNLAFVVATVGSIVSNPGQFLNVGPGVNAFVHAIAFLGGYFAVYMYRYRTKLSRDLRHDALPRMRI